MNLINSVWVMSFYVSDVTLNKKAKQQIAETMMNENKKQEPSKDVHLQALKIFINLFPKGMIELLLKINEICCSGIKCSGVYKNWKTKKKGQKHSILTLRSPASISLLTSLCVNRGRDDDFTLGYLVMNDVTIQLWETRIMYHARYEKSFKKLPICGRKGGNGFPI